MIKMVKEHILNQLMNRINKVFKDKRKFCPYILLQASELNDTVNVIESLEKSGVDIVEIGLPYSDPLADGPTIQESSTVALKNGMTTKNLFKQLKNIRSKTNIPLVIMGYLNPIIQYGIESFCKDCQSVGIDGLIIPDLPADIYHAKYKEVFYKYRLLNMFLITPQTSDKGFDSLTKFQPVSFIWLVVLVLLEP